MADKEYEAAESALDAAITAIGYRSVVKPAPDAPGRWYWLEWKAEVNVYKKPRGRYLYVKPPGASAVEIRITPKIAGGWIAVLEAGPNSGVPDPERRTAR